MERAPKNRFAARFLAILIVVICFIGAVAYGFAEYLRAKGEKILVETARDRYHCTAEWKSVTVSIFPPISITARDLVLRQKGRPGIPPLITIRKLTAGAGLIGFLRSPKHLRSFTFEGLVIQVTPGGPESQKEEKKSGGLIIDNVRADGTILRIFSKDSKEDPLTWNVYRLSLKKVGTGEPMQFRATLRNAVPPGLVETTGSLGPMNPDEPGLSGVKGEYKFEHADLSVFGGISGKLASRGKFDGSLMRMNVEGWTDVPDFTLRISGHPVHLKTQFKAVVDGMTGDVKLDPVKAEFRRTHIVATGSIAGHHGKTLQLDATVRDGRVEDMLWLALKEKQPTLRGAAGFHATIEVPPGPADIARKIRIQATAGIQNAELKPKLQEGAAKISDAARGDPVDHDADPSRLASDFEGAFRVEGGVAHFQHLAFAIPGAHVVVNGSYDLISEAVDLDGTARLEAKLSETQKGIKSFLLKPFDALFKSRHHKEAQAALPIHIGGTLDNPTYGPSLGRWLARKL